MTVAETIVLLFFAAAFGAAVRHVARHGLCAGCGTGGCGGACAACRRGRTGRCPACRTGKAPGGSHV